MNLNDRCTVTLSRTLVNNDVKTVILEVYNIIKSYIVPPIRWSIFCQIFCWDLFAFVIKLSAENHYTRSTFLDRQNAMMWTRMKRRTRTFFYKTFSLVTINFVFGIRTNRLNRYSDSYKKKKYIYIFRIRIEYFVFDLKYYPNGCILLNTIDLNKSYFESLVCILYIDWF